jgi:A/G-specific adenine glycosylase
MQPGQFHHLLLTWFDRHGRKHLPWQQDINAYRVWVSEIMLQQTQVNSVIGYFNNFISRFPDVTALANSELDTVLQHWAGLGYYARARNLHRAARYIADNGGEFPQTFEALAALPGIGRSTAGAILSIAFGQRQPILDGNVKRVLARFHAIHGWPGDGKVAEQLWQLSDRYTPAQRNAAYTQAMMDLGATLCTRARPRCCDCPVSAGCLALHQNLVEQLPEPKPRKLLPIKYIYMLGLQDADNRLLLEKRPPTGIWGGLWSLPEFTDLQQLQTWCLQRNYRIDPAVQLASRQHSFSHYQLNFTPILAKVQNPNNNVMEADSHVWYKARDIEQLGLPAPIKRLLQQIHPETSNDKID